MGAPALGAAKRAAFCPLSLSRRLRLFASPALPVAHPRTERCRPSLRLGRQAYFRGPSSTTRETQLSARCRRRSKSPYFAPGPRIPRLPMRFHVRSTSRRSRWFASATLRRRAVGACLSSKSWDVAGRERRCSKQSKSARGRPWTKRGADLLREDQAWSERHGGKQQMSATRFAAPSFFVCGTGAPGRPRRGLARHRRPQGRHYARVTTPASRSSRHQPKAPGRTVSRGAGTLHFTRTGG